MEVGHKTLSVKLTPTYEFMLWQFGREYFVAKRPINKATGKPWQARRGIYRGENGLKALREFNMAVKAAAFAGGR